MKKTTIFALMATMVMGMGLSSCSKEEKNLVSKSEAEGKTTTKQTEDALWAKFSTAKNDDMKGYWVNYDTVNKGMFDENFSGEMTKGLLSYYFDGKNVTSYTRSSANDEWKKVDGPYEYKCNSNFHVYVRVSNSNYVINTYQGDKMSPDGKLALRVWDGCGYGLVSSLP